MTDGRGAKRRSPATPGRHLFGLDRRVAIVLALTLLALDLVGANALWRRLRGPPVVEQARELQVTWRAARLGVGPGSALTSFVDGGRRLARARAPAPDARPVTGFSGRTTSALDHFLEGRGPVRVAVLAPVLRLDAPILLGPGQRLDLGATVVQAQKDAPAYAVRISRADGVRLTGGRFEGVRSGVLAADSRDVRIEGALFEAPAEDGVVVTGVAGAVVADNRIERPGHAGVLVTGGSREVVVTGNVVRAGRGASNWDAGVVVSHDAADVRRGALRILSDNLLWPRGVAIRAQLTPPIDNVVAGNVVEGGRSGGIYLDGALRTLVIQNVVVGESKEGLCLDGGAAGDVVAANRIVRSGWRWGMSDRELQLEFVLRWGRTRDGSSRAKLPGVSMDNTAYDLVIGNDISGNGGGGVKMVRTSFFNVIAANRLADDSAPSFPRPMPAILLGGMTLDVPDTMIDGAPSRGNVLLGNVDGAGRPAGHAADAFSNDNVFL